MMELARGSDEKLKSILHFVNLFLGICVFPDKLKIGLIKPIHKEMTSKRPKLLSNLTYSSSLTVARKSSLKQIKAFLKQNSLHCNRQYDFRENRSTKLALIDFVNEFTDALDAGDTGCFADLSKAFGCADQRILVAKPSKLRFRNNTCHG